MASRRRFGDQVMKGAPCRDTAKDKAPDKALEAAAAAVRPMISAHVHDSYRTVGEGTSATALTYPPLVSASNREGTKFGTIWEGREPKRRH